MRGRRREPFAPIVVPGSEARSAGPLAHRVFPGRAVGWYYGGSAAPASSSAAPAPAAAPSAAASWVGVDRRVGLEQQHLGSVGGLDRDRLRSGE